MGRNQRRARRRTHTHQAKWQVAPTQRGGRPQPEPADPDTLVAELADDERASTLADLAGDDDPKLAWEQQVRDHLTAMGYDPAEVEANAGGFGMDFAEWQDDPEGYATDVAEEAYGDKW